MLATGVAVSPCGLGQPLVLGPGVGGGAVAAVTTAVGTVVTPCEPSAFFAVTRTRSVFPLSTLASV
jgi:hypothetical protein